MRHIVRATAAMFLCAAIFSPVTGVGAAGRPAPLKVFKPILHQLSQVQIPVYLPTWLPKNGTVFPLTYVYNRGKAFEVDLSSDPKSPSTSITTFWIVGNLTPLRITAQTQRVHLNGGRLAYVDPNRGSARGMTITWKQSGYVYAIGKTGTKSDLIRVVNSLVRVH